MISAGKAKEVTKNNRLRQEHMDIEVFVTALTNAIYEGLDESFSEEMPKRKADELVAGLRDLGYHVDTKEIPYRDNVVLVIVSWDNPQIPAIFTEEK